MALERAKTHRSRAMLIGSGLLELGRGHLARLAIPFQFVGQLVAFVQRANARTLDRGDVHEHVGAAVIGLDEAKALGRIEPLYSTGRHVSLA